MRTDDGQVDRETQQHEDQRGQRAGGCDLELLAGRGGVAAHLREPAEQEQLDSLDLDSLPPRRERVTELVQDKRGKEQQHGDDGGQVSDAVGAVQRVPE